MANRSTGYVARSKHKDKVLVDVKDAAEIIGVKETTVRHLCYRGELEAIKVGLRTDAAKDRRRLKIVAASIDRYIARGLVEQKAQSRA